MKKIKKLKAFSIVELVVALAIGAILVTISYFAYDTIQKTFGLKRALMKHSEQMHNLHFLMQMDFNRNQIWSMDKSSPTVKTQDGVYQYNFAKDKIQRKQGEQIYEFGVDELKWSTEKHQYANQLKQIKLEWKLNNREYVLIFPLNQTAKSQINIGN